MNTNQRQKYLAWQDMLNEHRMIADNPPILQRFLIGSPYHPPQTEWRVPLYPVPSFSAAPGDSRLPILPRVEAVYQLIGYAADRSPIMEYRGVEVFGATSNHKVSEAISDLVEFAEQVEREAMDRIVENNGIQTLRWKMEIQFRLHEIKNRLAETGIWWRKR